MPGALRMFVSSTSEDLVLHRQVVRDVVVACGYAPVMMQDFGAVAAPTVAACRDFVASSDLVIAVCAFRRGWVPSPEQGGDGDRSITGLEIEFARQLGKDVYVFLADESWPGSLYEPDQVGRDWVKRFRAHLNQPAAMFHPGPVRPGRSEPEPTDAFRLAVERALLRHSTTHPKRPPTGATGIVREILPLLAEAARGAGPVTTVAAIATEYRRAAPPGWGLTAVPGSVPEAVVACATDLARSPTQSDGTAPLLRFVRAVARLFPAHTAALTAWADGAAGALGESHAAPEEDSRPTAHLLIHVQGVRGAGGPYRLKAWLTVGRESRCLAAGEDEYQLGDLPAVVGRLREEAALYTDDPQRVWVEFLLPRQLIGEAVDQWVVALDFDIGDDPVGAQHPVVVRVADRYSRPLAAAELRKRGARLRQNRAACVRLIDDLAATEEVADLALRIPRADAGGALLFNRLQDEPRVLCVVLGEPPAPDTREAAKTCTLNTLLAAGVPVVVWSRGGAGPCETAAGLIADRPLAGLPAQVHRARRDAAAAGPGHPGRHLALLWDDPDRVPPDLDPRNRLRPPE